MSEITYPLLGSKQRGNLGNNLFQLASLIGIADQYGLDPVIPEWKYAQYFNLTIPQRTIHTAIKVSEPYFHHCAHLLNNYEFGGKGVAIDGWLQSEKYWEGCVDKVKKQLSFKHPVKSENTIAISIRRGDYVGNPNYVLLSIDYYINAIFDNFPDWRDYKIIIFSDDMPYCKVHFSCLSNVKFSEGLNDIEQLRLMASCDHFIIANSTFSWWGAYLGEKEHSKVIRPAYLFAGKLAKENKSKDFYPERWTKYDHINEEGKPKRIDLSDVTFTVPVSYDHNDRQENLELSLGIINRHFNTNIIIMEQGQHDFNWDFLYGADRHRVNHTEFHRTKMLNQMAFISQTPIVVNWDCDIIIPPLQIFEAVERIRNGQADMVYPYDGRFARVERAKWLPIMHHYLDAGMFKDTQFKGMLQGDMPSVGGAVVVNKKKFFEAGGENENFVSYGPEDIEREQRWKKLGYRVQRVHGTLYHMDHFIGINSSNKNPHFTKGWIEYRKIDAMSKEQLKEYVASWSLVS